MSPPRVPARRALTGWVLGPLAALVVVAASTWWWLDGGPARQGYSTAGSGACPPAAASVAFPVPPRDRLDRFVLPVGPVPVAPLRATVCRYVAGGRLVDGLALDPARTAWLAAAVAAPPAGWPGDALAAKRPPELTAAQLAALRPADCRPDGPAQLITFDYPSGPPVLVRVRTGPCADLSNGTIAVRTPPAVTAALAALPDPPGRRAGP